MTYTDVEKERRHRGCWCPELKGKTAIVTGAGGFRGLGRSIALELARQGVNIVLTDIQRDPAALPQEERDIGWQGIHSVAKDVEAAGAGALPLFSDVSDAASVDQLVAAAMARFGGIDFLINNAGAPVGRDRGPVVNIPPDAWMRVVNVNLNGTFLMSRAVAQTMIARGQGGAIVNISSAASRQATAGTAAYTATKAAINALGRVMAMELAQHRIRVNAVLPGLTVTARTGDMPKQANWPEFVKGFVPLGFAGDGGEIAAICTYLCSDMGRWITGQDFGVDGGSTWH